MFCWNCGTKIPDKSKFCMNCGAAIRFAEDVSDSANTSFAESKEAAMPEQDPPIQFVIQGTTLEFPSSIREYTKMRKDFVNQAEPFIHREKEKTVKLISALDSNNIDKCVDIFSTFGLNVSHKLIDTVHQNLMHKKIYTLSRDQVAELYYNTAQHFAKEYDSFYEEYLEIIGDEEKLKQARELKRAGRSYWQGGGFGIRGALVGAAKAGVLNAGTGLVRGIGDALTDAGDRNKVYKKKSALLGSKNWGRIFERALLEDMYQAYDVYASILSDNQKLSLPQLDALLAKTFFQNGLQSTQYAEEIDLCLKALQSYPFNCAFYYRLGKLVGYTNNEFLRICDYFLAPYQIREYARLLFVFIFALQLRTLTGDTYRVLDSKIALIDQQLSMVKELKLISKPFEEACILYEQAFQKMRQDFLTSNDGNHFQSVQDFKEWDEYKKYRQETLTRIVPFERQEELFSQAKARHFQNPVTIQDLERWETELSNCRKAKDTYPRSFEHYFFRSCVGSDPKKVVARFPMEVQAKLANIPYISITQFLTVQTAKIRSDVLAFSKIDAWFFASDFYIGVVIPNRSEAHIVQSKDMAQIQLQQDILTFHKNDSTCESTKLLLPSEGDPDLVYWINVVNGMLVFARNRMSKNLCPVCGKPLLEGAIFCGNCGYRLTLGGGQENDL